MNTYLYLHEIKIRLKSFTIWVVALCGIIFLGMAFYPTFSESGILDQISVLLDSPFFSMIMKAFGVDFRSFAHPFGFYLSYLSIYTILAAMIFAAFLASGSLLSEIKDRTFEYLLARPLSRCKIFVTKLSAMVSLILALSLFMFFTGWLSLCVFRGEYQGQLNEESKAYELLIQQFKANGEKFKEYFNLSPNDYINFILDQALSQLDTDPELIKKAGIDPKMISDLVNILKEGSPESMFEMVREDPEAFMKKYNLPIEDSRQLITEINQTEAEYQNILKQLESDPQMYVKIFDSQAENYINQIIALVGSERLKDFNLAPNDLNGLIVYYDFSKLILLNVNLFIILFFTLGICLLISLLVNNVQTVLGASIGFVLLNYLVNAFAKVVEPISFLGKLTPFSLVPVTIENLNWGELALTMIVFFLLGLLLFGTAFLIFRRKDILG